MQPLEIILTPPLEAYIAAQVAAGRYPNASAVIREALGRMQAGEAAAAVLRTQAAWTRPATLRELYHALQDGVELDAGSIRPLESEFMGRLPALLECFCTTSRATPSPQLSAYCAKLRDRFGG